MNSVIEAMIARYGALDDNAQLNACKEVMQEMVLSGLSRSDFFDRAAFYGGTCLRIFHGLNRFSEDLDFALIRPDPAFALEDYFPAIEKELEIGRAHV